MATLSPSLLLSVQVPCNAVVRFEDGEFVVEEGWIELRDLVDAEADSNE